MADESELARRKALTFEQAEGLAELPRQLLPGEMPKVLRARLMFVLTSAVDAEMNESSLRFNLGKTWKKIFQRLSVEYLGHVNGDFDPRRAINFAGIESTFRDGKASKVYGLLQALIRIANSRSLSASVAEILVQERSAYRLVEGDTLVPFGSPEEAATLERALSDAQEGGLKGAHKHLQGAARELSAGNFADSVRESVHAVESVLRSLSGEPSLSKALAELSKRRPIHEAFKRGIMQLYGYGSDEPGVRHPLLASGDASVTEEDAMLMLGTCAAMVTYFSRVFAQK